MSEQEQATSEAAAQAPQWYDTNVYWTVHGTYAERKKKLAGMPRGQLEASILDGQYNRFLSDLADYRDEDSALREEPVDPTVANGKEHGKRLPYIGWYWRHVEFSRGTFPIGDSGGFIGFMENNKWSYPERMTTPEEFAKVMAIIDEAVAESQKGGLVLDVQTRTRAAIERLWPLLQTFKVA
ncbi:MAG: hypothetical protein KGJ23_07705 [Euryarchaeota archaeon]|nr:hypothetical protein [Euryarchaeota archaeon]MDE1836484.1 hypothetical protein [Euryarchaeota archaeon]MDE1880251.1 hypothetical protein [Euryarchaeota archaeon]MDE2044690.1 hypothetical protein [Thermoplasmata archaeon]